MGVGGDGGAEEEISQRSFVFLIGSNAQRRAAALLSWLRRWTGSRLQASELRGVGCRERLCSALHPGEAPGGGGGGAGGGGRGGPRGGGGGGGGGLGDRLGGSSTWLEAAFASLAFQKFKTNSVTETDVF